MNDFDENISPFFAIEAQNLLSQGNPEEAIILCQSGINKYPDYQSAYITLFRAYLQVHNYAQAKDLIAECLKLFPANKQLHNLKRELNQHITAEIKLEKDYDRGDGYDDLKDNVQENEVNEIDIENKRFLRKLTQATPEIKYQLALKATDLNIIPGLELTFHQFNKQKIILRDYIQEVQDISQIVSTIEIESINNFDEQEKFESNRASPLITETLAGIYESQGAIREAIRAYEVLALMYPDKSDKYNSKIEELRSRNT